MERSPKLPLHKIVPLFTLADKHGQSYNLAKQRGRAHMFLLVLGEGVDATDYLRDLASYANDWAKLPGRGIVVVPNAEAAGALGAQPFTVLIDEATPDGGKVRARFLPQGVAAGAFVLDRYGELYQQWLADDIATLPKGADLNGWLQAISMQCSI